MHFIYPFSGPARISKKKAKRAVSLAMCRRLHEDGLLNDNLLPRKRTLDSYIEELDCSESKRPKIGTKRSKKLLTNLNLSFCSPP